MRKNIFKIYVLIGLVLAFPVLHVSVGSSFGEMLLALRREITSFVICSAIAIPCLFYYHGIITNHYPGSKYKRNVLIRELLAFVSLILIVVAFAIIKFGILQGAVLSGVYVAYFMVMYNVTDVAIVLLRSINNKHKAKKI